MQTKLNLSNPKPAENWQPQVELISEKAAWAFLGVLTLAAVILAAIEFGS